MPERIRDALPRSFFTAVVLVLIGLPMGHFPVGHMALELVRSFLITFLVFLAVNTFYSWIIDRAKLKK